MKQYKLINLSLLIVNIFITTFGQIFLKRGALKIIKINPRSLISNFPLLLGVCLYGASFVLWLIILKRIPLSVAYPSLSLGYILIAVLSAQFFGEALTFSKVAGIFVIIFGVWLLFR